MKKLLLLLLTATLFIGCSSDDDNEPTQDYTSFVVTNSSKEVALPNVVVGCLIDGKYEKIATIERLEANQTSEEIVINSSVKGIYFFSDFMGGIKINKEFAISQNKKNNIILSGDMQTVRITDKTDPTQYPH